MRQRNGFILAAFVMGIISTVFAFISASSLLACTVCAGAIDLPRFVTSMFTIAAVVAFVQAVLLLLACIFTWRCRMAGPILFWVLIALSIFNIGISFLNFDIFSFMTGLIGTILPILTAIFATIGVLRSKRGG